MHALLYVRAFSTMRVGRTIRYDQFAVKSLGLYELNGYALREIKASFSNTFSRSIWLCISSVHICLYLILILYTKNFIYFQYI